MSGSRRSYAVVWRGPDGVVQPGRMTLGPTAVRFEGGRGRLAAATLPYPDIAAARLAGPRERVGGRPTLVLERQGGRSAVCVAGIGHAGMPSEVLERISQRLANGAA